MTERTRFMRRPKPRTAEPPRQTAEPATTAYNPDQLAKLLRDTGAPPPSNENPEPPTLAMPARTPADTPRAPEPAAPGPLPATPDTVVAPIVQDPPAPSVAATDGADAPDTPDTPDTQPSTASRRPATRTLLLGAAALLATGFATLTLAEGADAPTDSGPQRADSADPISDDAAASASETTTAPVTTQPTAQPTAHLTMEPSMEATPTAKTPPSAPVQTPKHPSSQPPAPSAPRDGDPSTAVQHLVAGQYPQAYTQYAALARSAPNPEVYGLIARVLQKKNAARCPNGHAPDGESPCPTD